MMEPIIFVSKPSIPKGISTYCTSVPVIVENVPQSISSLSASPTYSITGSTTLTWTSSNHETPDSSGVTVALNLKIGPSQFSFSAGLTSYYFPINFPKGFIIFCSILSPFVDYAKVYIVEFYYFLMNSAFKNNFQRSYVENHVLTIDLRPMCSHCHRPMAVKRQCWLILLGSQVIIRYLFHTIEASIKIVQETILP